MPKNILQDIKPPKSIRNVPVPSRHRPQPNHRSNDVEKASVPRIRRREPPRLLLWILAVISLVALAFVILSLFSGATVYVTPKTQSVTFATGQSFLAQNDGNGAPFDIITISKTESNTVTPTGSTNVSTSATGTITIFNNYSTKPELLVARTRFETADGKIYRTSKSITVPGRKTSGGTTTPGSIDAVVTADVAGVDYNIPAGTNLTVPGLKGTALYDGIYAKTKTDLSGGLIGKKYSIGTAQEAATIAALDETLKGELPDLLKAQIPNSYVVPQGGTFMFFDTLTPQDQGNGTIAMRREGKMSAIILNETDLSQYLAKATIGDPKGQVELRDIGRLSITITPALVDVPTKSDSYNLTVSGQGTFEWLVNTQKLQNALANQPKSALQSVLVADTAIDRASVSIQPFWKQVFPDAAHIKINLQKND